MKTEIQILISALIFGGMTIGFILLASVNDMFTLILIVAMFVSYWFGRFWEKKTIRKQEAGA